MSLAEDGRTEDIISLTLSWPWGKTEFTYKQATLDRKSSQT